MCPCDDCLRKRAAKARMEEEEDRYHYPTDGSAFNIFFPSEPNIPIGW